MFVSIAPEYPDTPDAIALITELEGVLSPFYPAESRHGFSVEKLIQQGVAFFRIPPFADYWDDPLSLFFEKRLWLD